MTMLPRIISLAGGAALLASMQGPTDACTLLTPTDAGTALGVTALPGKHLLESNATLCGWSNDPTMSDTSRRVVLAIVTPAQVKIASHPTMRKIEAVSGIGDQAFYQIYPSGSPFIWVQKGNNAVSIRILTPQKPAPFTVDQEKAKLAVLAKAAAAKL